jgi:hypothetical protein
MSNEYKAALDKTNAAESIEKIKAAGRANGATLLGEHDSNYSEGGLPVHKHYLTYKTSSGQQLVYTVTDGGQITRAAI